MDADSSVELGPTAPALEIPWKDSDGKLQYFDLRAEPGAIEQISEARQFPALGRFLVSLNSGQSNWQTAKCDVWMEDVEAAENLYGGKFSHSSYVDLVLAPGAETSRADLELHETLADDWAELLEEQDELEASAEIVVRGCYFHPDGNAEESEVGYCMTLFLTGYGASPAEAADRWKDALEFAASCLLKLQVQ